MSINVPEWDDDKPATQHGAETSSDTSEETKLSPRQSESPSVSVVGIVERESPDPELAVAADDARPVETGTAPLMALLAPATLPVIIGGLSGAIAAILAVIVLAEFHPPMDPRVEPLARHVGTFTERMLAQETSLRAVEVDLVRTLDRQADVSAEVAKQNVSIQTALGQVAMVSEQLRVESGPGSSVFGVAVVQLSDGIARGRSFEAEWVNLFALTAGEPSLRARLQRLLPFSRSGVDTIDGLRDRIRAGAKRARLTIARPDDIFWIAADYLQTQLGLPLGTTPAMRAAEAALTEADRRLASNDVPGAIALVADLGLPFADAFGTWLEAARRRDLADGVANELTMLARRKISERARRLASVKGTDLRNMKRRTAPLRLTQ